MSILHRAVRRKVNRRILGIFCLTTRCQFLTQLAVRVRWSQPLYNTFDGELYPGKGTNIANRVKTDAGRVFGPEWAFNRILRYPVF